MPNKNYPACQRNFASKIRSNSLKMVHLANASHIGSCLSIADILAHLYGGWLIVDPECPQLPTRDRLVVSKGHAAAAVYASLAERKFFPKDWLWQYCEDGGRLAGHVTHKTVPGVEVSTGSLGHGLPLAVGMAHALKQQGATPLVVVIISDGECNEGTTWESALLAAKLGLNNLVVIIDYNKIQSLGRVNDVMPLEPLAEKWDSFGWGVMEIDGHDDDSIHSALTCIPYKDQRPSLIIAHTVKGKGVSFMENTVMWHYKSPNDEQLAKALAEVEILERK